MATFESALQHFESGDMHAAEAGFRAFLQTNGHHSKAMHLHAICLYRLERFDEAVAGLNNLIAAHEGHADFLESRGVAFHRWGRNEEALADFEAALALEPAKGYRYACRAWIRDKMGDVGGAVADYRRAIELDPGDEISQNNLELMEAKLGYQAKGMFRHRTAAHMSDEEIEDYRKDFEARHPEPIPPAKHSRPGFSDYLREVKETIATRKGWKGFLAFVRRGFRQA